MKSPAFQFYPGDWLRDPALRSCSLAARGVWIDLLCLMHESPRRGYLVFPDGNAMKFEHLARIFSVDKRTLRNLISELELCGVFSREGEAIYSRRMVKDQQLTELRRAAGKGGGNPVLVKQTVKQMVNQKDKQNPTPSSSSSSSSINNTPIVPSLDPADVQYEQTPEYWSERLRDLHPKPSAKRLVEQFCVDHWLRLGDAARYAAFMAEVAGSLAAWGEYWRSEGGRYAPTLQAWLHDEGYRKQPPPIRCDFDDVDPFARRAR